jgi:hypothetical protein
LCYAAEHSQYTVTLRSTAGKEEKNVSGEIKINFSAFGRSDKERLSFGKK